MLLLSWYFFQIPFEFRGLFILYSNLLAVFEQIRPRRTTFRFTHQLQSPGSYCISSGTPMRVPERVSHGTSTVSAWKGMVQEECEKQEEQEQVQVVAGGSNSFRFMDPTMERGSGLEMYTLYLSKSGLKLVEHKKANVSWYVYTHESRLVLLASGMQCKTLSGYQVIVLEMVLEGILFGAVNSRTSFTKVCGTIDPSQYPWRLQDQIQMVSSFLLQLLLLHGWTISILCLVVL